MKLEKKAQAGTLESSDAFVTVEPADELEVTIESSVLAQFGDQIRETVDEVLKDLEVNNGHILVDDRGALDCTLRSRVQTAVFRSIGQTEDLPWRTKL